MSGMFLSDPTQPGHFGVFTALVGHYAKSTLLVLALPEILLSPHSTVSCGGWEECRLPHPSGCYVEPVQ
jgi:hypothetical protein